MLRDRITALYVKSSITLAGIKSRQRGVSAVEYTILLVVMAGAVYAAFGQGGTNSLTAEMKAAIAKVTGYITSTNTK